MFDQLVYRLTSKGEAELHSGKTTVAPLELELLVRMDGVHEIGKLRESMSKLERKEFDQICYSLLDKKLIEMLETDPFADKFQIELDKQALTLAGATADSSTASLKRAGYFVNIAHKRSQTTKQSSTAQPTAVVVEDEPILAKFIECYLSMEGFRVRHAANRNEVLEELRATPVPDLILLDVMLPDIDGFNILLRLRQHPAFKEVPVIMLTGLATREDVLKGLAGGADGYVTKPFQAETLLQAVHTVTGKV
jgi:two-component system, OmpR family, response regulator